MRQLLAVAGIVIAILPLVVRAQVRAGGGPGGVLGPLNSLGQEVRLPPPPAGPAPRLPDGTIDLNGVWNGGGPGGALAQGLKPGETLPLLASAKALMDLRATREMDDPFFWCMPMGVPRTTPYPFRFVQNYTHKAPTHRPFTVTYPAALSPPSDELMENFCQENNQFGIAGGNVNPYTK